MVSLLLIQLTIVILLLAVYLGVTTRPDISHAVYILSQFVSAPTQVHYTYLHRVL